MTETDIILAEQSKPLVILDFGNVIAPHDNAMLLDRLAKASEKPETIAAIGDSYARSGCDTGAQTVRRWFHSVRDEFGLNMEYPAFNKIWCCLFSHDKGMEELVERLTQTHRVVILSNADDAHWTYQLGEYPVMGKVHALYTSFELGLRKPGAAIYEHVLKAEGYEPSNAVFFDDRLENVEGARHIGIHARQFAGQGQFETDLKELGVDIGPRSPLDAFRETAARADMGTGAGRPGHA